MEDSRNAELAKVFVDHSMKVKKGDKVVIMTSDLLPIELIRETYKLALKRGAIVFLDIMGWNLLLDRSSYGNLARTFYEEASDEQMKQMPEVYKNIVEWGDKFIRITSLDNYEHLQGIDPAKPIEKSKAYHEWFRIMIDEKEWVLTYYPTEGMAQKSGMELKDLYDFYFSSVLVDYDEMQKQGQKVADLMDTAKKVHIVGDKTDLTIDITGRLASNSCGLHNIPDGEVYLAPVHLNTEGHVYYELPFAKAGRDIVGAYLEFEKGKVVKATAEEGEKELLAGLDTDEGSRYLGELGIGLNYGIDRVMRNTIFDEKIGGTLHITLGEAYTYERGGNPGADRNISAIHWDLVKDMRKPGSYVEVDGVVMFRDGKWLV